MDQANTNIGGVAKLHGLYYCAAGIWPLLHMNSFLLVTGPKTDLWLVETVSVLVLVVGLGLIAAGFQKRISFPLVLIALGIPAGLIFVEVIYVWGGVISPVYLLDALVEVILFVTWIYYTFKTKPWRSQITNE